MVYLQETMLGLLLPIYNLLEYSDIETDHFKNTVVRLRVMKNNL